MGHTGWGGCTGGESEGPREEKEPGSGDRALGVLAGLARALLLDAGARPMPAPGTLALRGSWFKPCFLCSVTPTSRSSVWVSPEGGLCNCSEPPFLSTVQSDFCVNSEAHT